MRVMIFGARGNLGQAVKGEARQRGWEICEIVGDITKWSLVPSLGIRDAVDLVVFAQGTQRTMTLSDLTPETIDFILKPNLIGTMYATAQLVQLELLRKNALIVYCSSIQATAPRPGRGPYAVAKAGLEALARVVTSELAPEARAVALRLGQFISPMRGIAFSEDEKIRLEGRTLFGFVPERDIAKLIFDLYSIPHVAGCVINMEGGHLLNIW